jgi:hypothetical protein
MIIATVPVLCGPGQTNTPALMARRHHESGLLGCYISIHFG